jgi:hypothetical protein
MALFIKSTTLLDATDGRDKTLKVIQYTIKLVASTQYAPLISQLSMTRKILRLGHVLHPLRSLLKEQEPINQFSHLIGIANDISDDLICLSKLSLVPKSVGEYCGPLSDRLWFCSILLDLQELLSYYHRKKQDMTDQETFMVMVNVTKLLADLVFCSFDVFELTRKGYDPRIQSTAALMAALLGTYKLWVKIK